MVLKPGTELHRKALAKAAEFNDWRIARDNTVQVLRIMERTTGRVGAALDANFCHIVKSELSAEDDCWICYKDLDSGLKEVLTLCQEKMDHVTDSLGTLLKQHGIGVGTVAVLNDLVRTLPKPNKEGSQPKKNKYKKHKQEKKKGIIGFLLGNNNTPVKRLSLVSRPRGETE